MRLPAAERRRQLLSVSRSVFARNGFHETSMNDVATAAGVTKPVLYQHFDSKHELFRELLAEMGTDLGDTIAKATVETTSPREQIERGFAAYFAWVDRNRDAFELLFSPGTWREPDFFEAARRVEDAIAETVADHIIIEGLTDKRRMLLARGLVGMAESTCRIWLSEPEAIDHAELAAQVAELGWFGLRGIRGTAEPSIVEEPA